MTKEKNTVIDEGNYDPYEELANAIVIQACDDYKRAYTCHLRSNGKGKRTARQLADLEYFFRSDWYKTLTEVDGEQLMERLRAQVASEDKKTPK